MKFLGKISRGDWEHLKKITPDTPPTCPYIVMTISTKKKFGITKNTCGIYYEIYCVHLQPPVTKSKEIIKPTKEEWAEAENTARALLSQCSLYEPAH